MNVKSGEKRDAKVIIVLHVCTTKNAIEPIGYSI